MHLKLCSVLRKTQTFFCYLNQLASVSQYNSLCDEIMGSGFGVWFGEGRSRTVIAKGESVVVAGGVALMQQNCLPEGKMSNRCLSGQKWPADIFSLCFSLLLFRSLMEGGWQHATLSAPQMTFCSSWSIMTDIVRPHSAVTCWHVSPDTYCIGSC